MSPVRGHPHSGTCETVVSERLAEVFLMNPNDLASYCHRS